MTSVFFSFLGPLFLGIILDAYGPRTCSVISLLLVTIGSALFAISNVPNFPMFVPAASLIAFGGPGVQSAIVHISNLFPGHKALVTAFITGSFQLSFIIFFVFDQLWHFGQLDYQMLFMGYGAMSACSMFVSAILWPDEPYSSEDYENLLSLDGMEMDVEGGDRERSGSGNRILLHVSESYYSIPISIQFIVRSLHKYLPPFFLQFFLTE